MRSIVNRTAGTLLLVVALVATQSCDRRAPTENHQLTPALTSPQADLSPGTLGKYQIAVPPENNPSNHNGTAPSTYTGIRIPGYSAYVISVNGRVSTTKNLRFSCLGANTWPYDGLSFGPLGTGTNNDLAVTLSTYNLRFGSTVPVTLSGTAGANGPTEVKTDTMFTWDDIDLSAGRNGTIGACDDVGKYLMSGSQTLTVEEITNTLKLTPPQYYVHPGTRVTFTASMADGSALSTTINWAWTADSVGARSVGGVCGTNANPCSVTPTVSGTVRVAGFVLGKGREAKGHVTVYQNFTLESDSTNAHRLSKVRFTPKVDGKTARAARWRWDPSSDTTSCGADTTCVKQIIGTGKMWAYLATTGGDSAMAPVTLVPDSMQLTASPSAVRLRDNVTFTATATNASFSIERWSFEGSPVACGSNPQCIFAPPFTGRMWVYGIVGGLPDSTSALVTVTLDPNDLTTVGTDSSAILRIKWSPGISGSPVAGAYVYPKGSDVHYQFATSGPYTGLVTVLDDTLAVPSDTTLHLSTDRSVEAAADRDFASDDEVLTLQHRLHDLVRVAPSAAKYRQHLIWYADSAAASLRAPDSLDIKLEAAALREFDPSVDRGALLAYDAILSGHVFEYSRNGTQSVIGVLSPETYAPQVVVARRLPISGPALARAPIPGGVSKTASSVHISAGTKLVYINGIRTSWKDVVGDAGTLKWLDNVVQADPQLQTLKTAYFYNRNLDAQLAAYDSASGCAGVAMRGSRIWHPLTSRIRYFRCKVGSVLHIVKENDFVEAATEYAQLLLRIAGRAPEDVNTLAARLTTWYHDSTYDVILITHSQGNMIAAQAMPIVQGQEQSLNTVFCTAEMSLASPVPAASFFPLSSTYIDGVIMNNDVLLMFGAQNGFLRQDTDTSRVGADSIAAASFIRKPLVRLKWGIRIHEVNWNYLRYPNSVALLQTSIEGLYAKCQDINNIP